MLWIPKGYFVVKKLVWNVHIKAFWYTIVLFKWIKLYFPRKRLKKICFSYQINLTIGERPNKKNIESRDLIRKVNLLRLWREKIIIFYSRRALLHDGIPTNSGNSNTSINNSESNLLHGLVVLDEFCKELAAIALVKYHIFSGVKG